jgi:hypothetical protein
MVPIKKDVRATRKVRPAAGTAMHALVGHQFAVESDRANIDFRGTALHNGERVV